MSDKENFSPSDPEERRAWYNNTRDKRQGIRGIPSFGGAGSHRLAEEIELNYVAGNFLSTIITGCSLIESMLYHQVWRCDTNELDNEYTLRPLIRAAKQHGVINEDVTDVFNPLTDICDLRNSTVHYRPPHGTDDIVHQHHTQKKLENAKRMMEDNEAANAKFEQRSVDEYGKDHAEKVLKAMFDIRLKCYENSMKALHQQGPLVQGIGRVTTGKKVYCDHCGTSLQDRPLEYDADWDGQRVVNESARCPDCGENTISTLRDSWKSSDELNLDYTS